jgi:hypothetical protein
MVVVGDDGNYKTIVEQEQQDRKQRVFEVVAIVVVGLYVGRGLVMPFMALAFITYLLVLVLVRSSRSLSKSTRSGVFADSSVLPGTRGGVRRHATVVPAMEVGSGSSIHCTIASILRSRLETMPNNRFRSLACYIIEIF